MKKDIYELKNEFYNILLEFNNLTALNIKKSQSTNDICWQINHNLKSDQDFGDYTNEINDLAKQLEQLNDQIEEEEIKKRRLEDTVASFCPFGYLDIKAAFEAALEAGKEPETFVFACCEDQAKNFGCAISEVDPVAAVYECLKSEAVNELNELQFCDNDALNDVLDEIFVAGNYLATSFDYHQKTIDKLQSLINEAKLTKDQLSECAAWFLDQLEIKVED